MTGLSDYDFKWVYTELGHYKYLYMLIFEGANSGDDKEIASIVKTKKGKILVEAKCDMIEFKTEQEFDEPKLANKFIMSTKKWIRGEIIKAKEAEKKKI